MDILASLVQNMTPEQRLALSAMLATPAAPAVATIAPPPSMQSGTAEASKKAAPLNMQDAIAIKFKASLVANDRCRDQSWAQQYDHIWFSGHYQVKGPKGGVYCLGRGVLGNPQREQYKGTLKISNRSFLELQQGKPIDGWFLPDDTKDNVFIGTLAHFQLIP